MKLIPAILIVAIFIRYNAIYTVAGLIGFSPSATWYLLGGPLDALLCAALLFPQKREVPMMLAAGIGITEATGLVGCRLAIPDMSIVPRNTYLCDHVTGLPITTVMIVLEVMALAWIIGPDVWKKNLVKKLPWKTKKAEKK